MSKFRQIKRNLERKADAESEAKRTQERLEREKQHREKLAAEREEKKKEESVNKIPNYGFKGNYDRLMLSSALLACLPPVESRIK